MNPVAARAAVKFSACLLLALFGGVVVYMAWGQYFKIAIYTASIGLCIKLIWPTQDEGDALRDDVNNGRR